MRNLGERIEDKDIELVLRVREGDLNAFRTLVDLYKDKSLSLAASIVKNPALAEDIVQDVFMKVYKNIGKFKFKSSFATWIYRIVVNTCYSELKRKSNTSLNTENDQTLREIGHAEQPLQLTGEDQRKYIQKAMKMLRPDEALVLRLFYLCEMSLKEIEAITKSNSSKIRVDLYRGRKNLKQQLEQLLGDEIDYLL
ncbi:RNA polymerase sigma factor [Luteirhabdus pelagi]|uniref:RNA polymerase sigma factor n=1 Tax=Luteirhabdus pelagi TaxID=2792783 RepID=UPI001F223F32|nr:RNA polymerase sigma factor [Luteirhabdus pelagi]